MKTVVITVLAASLGVLSACQPGSQGSSGAPAPAAAPLALETTAAGGPKRADGFWEFKLGDASVQYCVGEGSEEKYSLVDSLSLLGDCSKKDFKRTPVGWAFETVCSADNVTTTQKGAITGDFNTTYTIHQSVTQVPGGTVNGDVVARRTGDCPADRKPGDYVKDGFTANMLRLHANGR